MSIESALFNLTPGNRATFSVNNAYAHVWFDSGVAHSDFGNLVINSGEFDVRITNSPDPLNLEPRGQELCSQRFRYADPRYRDMVTISAADYIRGQLIKRR